MGGTGAGTAGRVVVDWQERAGCATRHLLYRLGRGWLDAHEERTIRRPLQGESMLVLVRALATSLRESMRRRSAWFPRSQIHVSPMSLQWLRTCEDEYDKHGAGP